MVVTDSVQISPQAQALYASWAASPAAADTGMITLTAAQAVALFKKTPAAAAVQIKDSSVSIAKNLDALQQLGDKIASITQSGIVSPLAITAAQLTSDTDTLSKITGDYTLAVSGVTVANANSVLGTSKVATISIADSSTNISSALGDLQALGTKLKAITQTGTKSALAANVAQITSYASTLAKIDAGKYTLSVSDTQDNVTAALTTLRSLGTKLGSITLTSGNGVFALSMAQFGTMGSTLAKVDGGKMAITDTSANVLKGLGSLTLLSSKIDSITRTDTGTTLAVSAKQVASSLTALGKIADDYKLAVTDTGASIVAAIGQLQAVDSHIVSIKQSNPQTALAMTATQYTNAKTTLDKINGGTYTAALSNVSRDDFTSLSGDTKVTAFNLAITDGDLSGLDDTRIKSIVLSGASLTQAATAAADKRVKSIAVSDLGANFTKTNVDALYNATKANLTRITKIEAKDATRQTLNVALADYKIYVPTFLSKVSNMSLQVDFTGSTLKGQTADAIGFYKTVANTNGSFTIQQWDSTVGRFSTFATLRAGTNFIKFSDATTFLDTGDKKLNCLLNLGTLNWMQSAAKSATTSSTQLAKGVYALDSSSVRTTINYSFLNSTTQLSTVIDKNGFQEMSDGQKAAVYSALNYYSSLINVTFNLVTDPTTADIRFGTNNQGTTSGGYATGGNSANGGVNLLLNNAGGSAAVNADMTQGGYGWETLIHEIGHTLGLKHPGNYNAGGGGAPGPYLAKADDTRRTTVMSYNNAADTFTWKLAGNGSYTGGVINPSTLMTEDILALQFLYGRNTSGASTSEASGDNLSLDDFQAKTFDSSWLGMETIAAGNDGACLDLSSVLNSNIVDCRAGAYSSINIEDASFNSTVNSTTKQAFFNFNNVGLAFGSTIKSIDSGSGNDVFYTTNSYASINGGGGNDKLMLYGIASDWTSYDDPAGFTLYTNNKDNTQIAASNIEATAYYNQSTLSMQHSRVDLKV